MLTFSRAAAAVWKSCATWSKSRAPCAALWVLQALRDPPRRGRLVWQLRPFELPAHSLDRLPLLPSPPGDYIPPYAPPTGEPPPLRGLRPPLCASGAPRFAPLAVPWRRGLRLRARRGPACGSVRGPVGPVRASLSLRSRGTLWLRREPRARAAPPSMSHNKPNVKSATCSRCVASGILPGSLRGFWPGSGRPERGPGK